MKNKKVIIVGAGMAGLTAASYLARENFDVLLLEKNDRIGGLVSTFEHKGFSFDTGPRAFINSGMVKPILKDLGINGEFLGNRVSIGIKDHLFSVDSMDALDEYERILRDLYPESAADVPKITDAIRKLSDYTKTLYQFDNPNFVDLTGDIKFILTELLPWTVKLLVALNKFNKFGMPMEDYLATLTGNQALTDIVLQHFFKKTPAYFALGYFHVYMDYFYPKDGTGVLPRLLHEKVLAHGGETRFNTHIAAVIPAEHRVTDSDGNSYAYDHLVWAGDLKTLYRMLDSSGLEAEKQDAIKSESDRILAARGAESSFNMFIGVDRPLSFFKERGGEHLFYTESREGLGETHRTELQNLIGNFDNLPKSAILKWLDKFCRLNTYEISVPALRDPSLAPDGQSGVMISCLFDYDLVEKINAAGWHDEFKQIMENHILKLFSGSIYAGFEEDILFRFSSTPLTIHNATGSSEGAITGWSFETDPPVEYKLKNIPRSARTSIPGVYKAGMWAYVPAGVPIAMLTGWHASQEIIKRSAK